MSWCALWCAPTTEPRSWDLTWVHMSRRLARLQRFDAIAPHWAKKSDDVPGLQSERLFATLKKVYEAGALLRLLHHSAHALRTRLARSGMHLETSRLWIDNSRLASRRGEREREKQKRGREQEREREREENAAEAENTLLLAAWLVRFLSEPQKHTC